ncbi:serine hydrolase domain-containing protein [Maritalea sp.]|uniref:serine hydrolase domain-containing protein n=1 Tax=Maritalea sp. TaxID=2003361 RepID=UPI003EF65A45
MTGPAIPQQTTSQTKTEIQTLLDQRLPKILEDAAQFGNGGVVMHNGEIIAQATAGLRKKGSDEPVTNDDKWHIGSITKSITATMIGRLVDQNKLSFDDTLGELLPQFAIQMDTAWHDVRLIDLLNHTSGVEANFGIKTMLNREFSSEEQLSHERLEAVLAILKNPPKNTPRTKFIYSNIGYTIAGTIAAQIMGESWEELVRRHVLQPLNLTSAGFGAPKGANPWGHATKLFVLTKAVDPNTAGSDNTPIIGPAGTVHMSLKDLASFANTHMRAQKGDTDFLSTSTTQRLHTVSELTKDTESYAAGWVNIPLELPLTGNAYFHNGSNTMWYAFLMFSPHHDAVVAFATNTGTIRRSEGGFGDLTNDIMSKLE